MKKTDKQTVGNTDLEKIEPLKLKEVTSIRGKVKRVLTRIGAFLGIGIAGGVIGGNAVQSGFRGISGYEPDWREKLEKGELTILNDKKKEETPKEKEQTPEEVEEETNGILDKITGALSKGAEMTQEAVKKLIDAAVNKLMEQYKDAEKQMLEKYYTAMEEVDNYVFWGSFWTSFSITIILALGLTQLKKLVLGESDPEVKALEKNLIRMQGKVNEMIEKQNAMMSGAFVLPQEQLEIIEQAKKLLKEFGDMQGDINGSAGDENAEKKGRKQKYGDLSASGIMEKLGVSGEKKDS